LNRKIKLIWDLRGLNNVLKTAQDHGQNIKYFAEKSHLTYDEIGSYIVSEHHAVAFVIIDEKDMITFRDALKPHRAVVAQ